MSLLSAHPTMLNGPYRENQLVLRDISLKKEPGEHDEVSEERLTISHHIKVHQFNPCVCTMSHPPNWRPHSFDPAAMSLSSYHWWWERIFFPTILAPFVFVVYCWFYKPFTCVILRSKSIRLTIILLEETYHKSGNFFLDYPFDVLQGREGKGGSVLNHQVGAPILHKDSAALISLMQRKNLSFPSANEAFSGCLTFGYY